MPQEPATVTIPLSLAVALFECYFGNGPRRAESMAAAHAASASIPPPSPPSDPLLPSTAAIAPAFSSGWVPRGAARPARPATMPPVAKESPPAAEL